MRLVDSRQGVGGVWWEWSPAQITLVHFTLYPSLSTKDLKEMCDKRDVYKKSYQQAADERDKAYDRRHQPR